MESHSWSLYACYAMLVKTGTVTDFELFILIQPKLFFFFLISLY